MPTLERTAVLDLRDTPLDHFSACLSNAELGHVNRFRIPGRRRQSLGARLCLKYVFLTHLSSELSDTFFPVHGDELNRFPAWLYREVCVTPFEPTNAPVLTWCGARLPKVEVSLTHSGSLCGGSIASERAVGIDVESVQARTPEFYKSYFSAAERTWVSDHCSSVSESWLFTLLWSLKECRLKAAGTEHRSHSSLAAIEVVGFPDVADLMNTFESIEFMLAPATFTVAMRGTASIDSYDCELAGNREQVIVVARQNTTRGRFKTYDS